MTLRISTSDDGKTTTVRAEGRLDAAVLEDFHEACRQAGSPLRLDLSGLLSADEQSVEALRLLAEEGAEFHGASAYIRQLLSGDGLSSSAT